MSFSLRTVVVLALVASVSQLCSAQQQQQRPVQRMLRTFIDSQLPSDLTPRATNSSGTRLGTPQGLPPSSPNNAPTRVPSRQPIGSRAAVPNANTLNASNALQTAAQLLAQASNEMSELVSAMEADLLRAPGVRSLLTLAFKVNSDAATLSRRLARSTDIERLREPLRQLDQDWRTLEYRLRQISQLSRATKQQVAKIQQYEAQLAAMFEVPTQVDLNAVNEQALRMNNAMGNLLDDIRYEVADVGQANRLLQEARTSYDGLQAFLNTSRSPTVNYESLTRDFKAYENSWNRYERRLRLVNNRFIQRGAQNVTDATRKIHELLYLNMGQVDRADLAHSLRLIQQNTDQLLDQVTLRMLSELPTARRFSIESAGDFATTCQDTVEIIEAGDDIDVVRDMYTYMHDEWERLSMSLQGIRSPNARQALRFLAQSMEQLQSQLGVQFGLDRYQAMELVANLTTNARHLQDDIRNFFGRPNRYPQDFQTGSLQSVAKFHAASRDLQARLSNGDKLQQLKTSSDNLSVAWENLNQYLTRFGANEKARMEQVYREITPQVIQMQTMFSL